MEKSRGKILVIRGGAIGDFILTLPVFSALRQAFPETHIEALGYPRLAELAMAGGVIDGFRSIEARPLAGFFARNGKLDPELSEYFKSFALIFSYLYDPDEIFKTNVSRVSKAQYIQGPHRPDESRDTHATQVLLEPLQRMAIFEANPVPTLSLRRSPHPPLPPGEWLAMHPGSGSPRKNWPHEKWADLIKILAVETDWNFLLVGGEAEENRVELLAQALPAPRVCIAQNRPLVEVAHLLGRANFFVGHDSGITHLAAALGVPLLALWGESKETIWRPIHPASHILKADHSLADIPAREVAEALKNFVSRLPSSFAE